MDTSFRQRLFGAIEESIAEDGGRMSDTTEEAMATAIALVDPRH